MSRSSLWTFLAFGIILAGSIPAFSQSSFEITNPNILPVAVMYRNYAYNFQASPAGSYMWTMTGAPPGWTINPSTGEMSGWTGATFAYTGPFNIKITATTPGPNGISTFKYFTLVGNLLHSLRNLNPITSIPVDVMGNTAVVGTMVNNFISINGGVPPYTLTPIGSLPDGLSIVQAETILPFSGNFGRYKIYGVPKVPGTFNFRLHLSDSSGLDVESNCSMIVSGLTNATTVLDTATYNKFYTFQLQGATEYNLAVGSSLPPGLVLSSSGLLSGTPLTTGSASFAVNFTSGSDTRRQTLFFNSQPDSGSMPLQFSSGGLIQISLGNSYKFPLPTVYPSAGPFTWTLDGILPPGISFNPSGPNLLEGVPTKIGNYTFRIRVENTAGKFGVSQFQMVITKLRYPGPFMSAMYPQSGLAFGKVGQTVSLTYLCANGIPPCTYSLPAPSLPTGLTLSPDGVLFGTLLEAGSYTVNPVITDATGDTKTNNGLLFVVLPADQEAGIIGSSGTDQRLEDAVLGSAYSFNLEDLLLIDQGIHPITWSLDAGSLPSGISIVPGNASISAKLAGIPTVEGNYTFTLLAKDANSRQDLVKVSLHVTGLTVSPVSLPRAVSGIPYSQQLTVTGGTAPYQFRLVSNDMPQGISLSSDGLLSGTSEMVTDYFFNLQIEAVDASGSLFFKRYKLDVAAPTWPDGTVPSTGGSVNDFLFGQAARVSIPPGMLTQKTGVAIYVLDPSNNQPPSGFIASSSYIVSILLTPQPSYPLLSPGATITIPLLSPQTPGTVLSLFVLSPDTGSLVVALDSAGIPITGVVDEGGITATFTGITHFSKYYAETVVDYGLSASGPVDPVSTNNKVKVNATLNQLAPYDSAVWEWGDELSTALPYIAGGVLSADHVYSQAGVYKVHLGLIRAGREVASSDIRYIVVYDPAAGFVTGGGWIDSPLGAYSADSALTGKATFGFVSQYKKGVTVPSGNTEFDFHIANLNFQSTGYEWLVVTGAKAQFKGVGVITGSSEIYSFMLTAIDGDLFGARKSDIFRIKIWGTGGLVYDNEIGKVENGDPSTILQSGSIVIHK